MTDILIARLTHGRLGFAVLHDVAPDWRMRAAMLGPFAAVPLCDGDAEHVDLGAIARLAATMSEASLTQILDAWRIAAEFAQPMPAPAIGDIAGTIADDGDNPDWLVEALRQTAKRGLGLRLVPAPRDTPRSNGASRGF